MLLGQFAVPGNLYAQSNIMPEPGMLITQSSSFSPSVLKGLTIHPDQPFHFDFFVDKGESRGNDIEFEAESLRLIKYFMASLAIPENDLWVNLSPYEQDRIIPEEFGVTEMGRDLLMQDYLLKQFTASLMYPEEQLGKRFWDRVYKLAYQRYGTTDIPANTFNKVWIVPDKAVIYEQDNTAYVVESRLKVMLEQDYLSLTSGFVKSDKVSEVNGQSLDNISSEVIKEILIPEIEREVNEGEHFAKLRQIYHSLILATWYKENIRQSLINQIYSDQNKMEGINLEDKDIKMSIYNQYLEAFKKGVYNYIREDYDRYKNQVVPRQYFSGGMKIKPVITKAKAINTTVFSGDMAMISARFDLAGGGKIIDQKSNAVDQAQNGETKKQVSSTLAGMNELYAAIMGQMWDPLTLNKFSQKKLADVGRVRNEEWKQRGYDRFRSLPAQLMLYTWYDAQESKVLKFEENLTAVINHASDEEKLKAHWARGIKTLYHLRFQGNHPESFERAYLDHYFLQQSIHQYVARLINHDAETIPMEYLWGLVAMLDPMVYHPHFLKEDWGNDAALAIPSGEARLIMQKKAADLMLSLFEKFDQEKLTRLLERAFRVTPEEWDQAGYRLPYVDFADDKNGFFFLFQKIEVDPDNTQDQIFLLARSREYLEKHVTFADAGAKTEKNGLFPDSRAKSEFTSPSPDDPLKQRIRAVIEKSEKDHLYYYRLVYGSKFFRDTTGITFEIEQPQPVYETNDFNEIRDIVIAWHKRGLQTMYMTKMTANGEVDLNTYWKHLKLFYIGDREHPKSILIAGTNYPSGNILQIEFMATDPQFEGRGYIKKLLATVIERYQRDYEIGGVFLFDDVDYLKEIGFRHENGEYRYSSPVTVESVQQKDESMVGAVNHFMEERSHELKRLFEQSTTVTADKARLLSLQWRSAMMKTWDDGKSIIHTAEELGEIGARMNALWKEAGFDRYGSWPAQMMLLNVRQLPEEQYFSFIEKQDALISRTTRQEKLTAYWLNGVKYASHLRYYGTHPEGHFQKPFFDNEILIDIAQKYIALLAEEDLDSLPLEYLWGLIVMLDPLVHNPDFRLDNWDEVVPASDPEMMMHDYIVRIFEGLKFQGVDHERLKGLLTKAFGMSDQQWTDAGFRSPYVEFTGFNFNLPLGDIFGEFYLKGDSAYPLDQVFLLARPQQFFLDNFRFVFNTRDPGRIKDFLFSNKRYQEPQNGIRQIFTNMSKTVVLEAVKKDPRYFYKHVFGSKFFQAETGLDHLGDILGGQKDAAVLGKKPTDEAMDRFITSSQIGEFFDFIDSMDLPQGATIKMIGSAETPQLGMAFALNGYDVRSITLDLKGTTIEETYQELLTDNIEAAGGHYRVYADTNYMDLPEEEPAPVMIAAINVLDDPKTKFQDKMIEKMFNEVSEGGYLIFDFVINKEYWYSRIETYADQNGYLIEPLHRMPIKGTVYKVTHKPALIDAAMTAEDPGESWPDVILDHNAGEADEAMFAFLRKNHRVLKRAMGEDVSLENLERFIYQKLMDYPLIEEWTRISELDQNENEIVQRAVYEWMRIKGMAYTSVTKNLLKNRMYVRNSDRKVYFRKEYSPEGGRYVISGGIRNIEMHMDFNDPLREALGVFLGEKLNVNTPQTVVTPNAIFSRFMMEEDAAGLPQQTMQGAESSSLVLTVFIRNSNDVKVIQRSLVGNTFVKFDFDQGFNRFFRNIERLADFYRGVAEDERVEIWENWFEADFDVALIRSTIQKVKGLNLEQAMEEFIQRLPEEFDKDSIRRKVEAYFELLKMTQTTIEGDVARMYRFFTSVNLPEETSGINIKSEGDQAVLGKEVGGIDFTPNRLDLEIHRDLDGLPIPLTDHQIQNIQINGLVPVILRIQPVTQLPFLFGAAKTPPGENSPKETSLNFRDEAVSKEPEFFLSVL